MENITEHILCCTTCKSKVELHKHYTYTRKDGTLIQKYMCKVCSKNRFKKWHHKNKDKFREIIRKSERKNYLKVTARQKVRYALKVKKILKKDVCEICQESGTQAHHKDYSKPLDVIWLCIRCHSNEHRIHVV